MSDRSAFVKGFLTGLCALFLEVIHAYYTAIRKKAMSICSLGCVRQQYMSSSEKYDHETIYQGYRFESSVINDL